MKKQVPTAREMTNSPPEIAWKLGVSTSLEMKKHVPTDLEMYNSLPEIA